MKKCIVVPDSFKGTISSVELCEISRKVIGSVFPLCEVVTVPVADGGEGTVSCFMGYKPGEIVKTEVAGPFMHRIDSFYGRFGDTAVVEMAAAAGLPLAEGSLNPCIATTYGVGELIRHAVEHGAKEVILGMGGSCTNDGGCGCAAALGVEFTDDEGNIFVPVGETLHKIRGINTAKASELIKGVRVTAMCDVEAPLSGQTGAAYVFAPQKGADEKMVVFLDSQLKHLGEVIEKELNMQIMEQPGTGAAGGLGAGALAFLGAQLKSGIDTVLDSVNFDSLLEGADMVFTGEGKIDSQSIHGKVISGICKRTRKKNVPVCAVVGDIGDDACGAYEMGVTSIFSINRMAIPFSEAKMRSKRDFENTLYDVVNLIKAGIDIER